MRFIYHHDQLNEGQSQFHCLVPLEKKSHHEALILLLKRDFT